MPSQTAKKKYPAQLVIVTTDEVADRIRSEAAEGGVSIAQVAREYIELGMEAADAQAKHDAAKAFALATPQIDASHPEIAALANDPAPTRPPLQPSKSAFTI